MVKNKNGLRFVLFITKKKVSYGKVKTTLNTIR